MKPEHNCPKCPRCERHVGQPICTAFSGWNHRADVETDNLICPACGMGWVGTPEEVEQAERAQLAWEARERAESWNERSGWYDGARVSMEGV